MHTFFFIIGLLSFIWFIIEIIRLEGYPGRKWHHAYIGVMLQGLGWWINAKNQHAIGWLIFGSVLIIIGIYLVIDDATQHNMHNRWKRNGRPQSEWPKWGLHKHYEDVIRDLRD